MSRAKAGKRIAGLPAFNAGLVNWQAILVIALAVAVFFRDILLQKAFFWEDFIFQYYGFRNFAAVSMAGGDLPLWNPYTFSGMPFQADIQTALFYIPNLLLTVFAGGGHLHFFWVELLIVVHFMIAGVCFYFLALDLGMQKIFALFSGLVYSLSGFMIMQLIHQTFVCEVAWLPLLLLLFRRALMRRSPLSVCLASLVLSQMILAGAPQLTLYTMFLLLMFFLSELVPAARAEGTGKAIRMAVAAGLVVALALGFAALQLLPTRELAGLSARAELSYEKSLDGSLDWVQLITLLVPKYFGSSGAQQQSWWLSQSYWQFWETCAYIGLTGLIAAVVALPLARRNRTVAFFAGCALFGLLYSLGGSFVLHPLFYHFVPGFDKFRSPGRMSLFFTLGGAILSGFGLERIMAMAGEVSAGRFHRIIAGIAVTAVAVWLLAQGGAFQSNRDPQAAAGIHTIAAGAASTSLLLMLAIAGILVLVRRRFLSRRLAVFVLMAVQFVDISLFAFDQNNGPVSPDEYYARYREVADRLKEEGKQEYFRINARSGGAMLLDRNQGMVDRIFMMEGYTPLALERKFPPGKDWDATCDLLNAKYRISVDAQQQRMSMVADSDYLPRAFMVYGTKVIHDEAPLKTYMEGASFHPAAEVVFEEDPKFALSDTGRFLDWSAKIAGYSLNAITLDVSTPRRGYLVLSEIYYPGWNAAVDGQPQPVYRADWCLRAIPVEQGKHTVEVRFEPASFRRGMIVSCAAAVLCLAAIGVSAMRKRRGGNEHELVPAAKSPPVAAA